MKKGLLLLFVTISLAAGAQKKRVPQKESNEAGRIRALELVAGERNTLEQSSFWPHITPIAFLDNLKRNIEYPLKINNGRSTNFCAFGAITYTCLKNEPFRYTISMLNLYKNGESYYRLATLRPSQTIKDAAGLMMFQGDLDIQPADQMWFLCLANRFKGYLNFFNKKYDKDDENTMWAATNLAKFNRMLRKMCKYKVQSKGSDLLKPKINNLPDFLEQKLNAGEVYLYLNNAILRKKNHNRIKKRIPTHYVALTGIEKNNDRIVIKYWDGGYKTLKEVTLHSLKQIIYGVSWVNYKEENNE
ncbi:MAG: hypothetical protein WBO38_08230 [Chitinophagaceae bacterium]